METPFVLQASLEKNYRRDTRYDLALRAILLRATAHSKQRLGKWIHDTRRLNRSDPGYYQGVTASLPSPLFRTTAKLSLPGSALSVTHFAASLSGATFAAITKTAFSLS